MGLTVLVYRDSRICRCAMSLFCTLSCYCTEVVYAFEHDFKTFLKNVVLGSKLQHETNTMHLQCAKVQSHRCLVTAVFRRRGNSLSAFQLRYLFSLVAAA